MFPPPSPLKGPLCEFWVYLLAGMKHIFQIILTEFMRMFSLVYNYLLMNHCVLVSLEWTLYIYIVVHSRLLWSQHVTPLQEPRIDRPLESAFCDSHFIIGSVDLEESTRRMTMKNDLGLGQHICIFANGKSRARAEEGVCGGCYLFIYLLTWDERM